MPKGVPNNGTRKRPGQETRLKLSAARKREWANGIRQPAYWHTKEWKEHLSREWKGPANPLWKGGRSKNYRAGYYSKEYREWRMAVFQRDAFRCQGCGQVGGYLNAHHIKSFANFPDLRFELDNGVTLCEACHSLTDNYKGRKPKPPHEST